MALVFMARQAFGVFSGMRRRHGFRLSLSIGAWAASVLLAVHGTQLYDTDETLATATSILRDLRNCQSHNDARSEGVPAGKIHSRTLCSSRTSFDYNPLRVPQILTTVECSCSQEQPCFPIGDYSCTTITHRFPVEYTNGTPAVIDVPVACACVSSNSRSAHTGDYQTT